MSTFKAPTFAGTKQEDKDDYFKSANAMGNEGMQRFLGDAFSAADKAGQDYFSDFWGKAENQNDNIDWSNYAKGMADAKSKAWDNFMTATDKEAQSEGFTGFGDRNYGNIGNIFTDGVSNFSAPHWNISTGANALYDKSADRNLLDKITDKSGWKPDGDLNVLAPWEAMQANNLEVLTDAAKQLNLTKDAAQGRYDSTDSAITAHKGGLLDALNPYGQAMQSASDALKQAQIDNAASKYQAITDVLRGATLGGQRATDRGTMGSTNRLLAGALAKSAHDRAGIMEGINLDAADRQYALASQLAGAKKQISDQAEQNRLQAKNTLAQTKETANMEFAEAVGATPDETAHLTELASEYVNHMVDLGQMEWENAEEMRKAVMEQMRIQNQLGGQYIDQYIELLLSDIEEMNAKVASEHEEAQAGLQNLNWLESLLQNTLTQETLPGLLDEDFDSAKFAQILSELAGISGGHVPWTGTPTITPPASGNLIDAYLPTTEAGEVDYGALSDQDVYMEVFNKIMKDVGFDIGTPPTVPEGSVEA